MTAPDSSQLLTLWELGERRHPLDRALLLFALAAPEMPSHSLADAPLGQCNAALMQLRRELFGSRLPVWTDCPGCGERMEFELHASQLPPITAVPASIDIDGLRFRCPSSRDLAEIAHCSDMEQAANQLLHACALSSSELPTDEHALHRLRAAVESALEVADPWADLSVVFLCPTCGHSGEACFDITSYLWEGIVARARQLLDEIHLLAQAYGWTEPQILALSDKRRIAYLARVCP